MFRIILLCLLTCCTSFMPFKQSESIISEDHTQVVERKTKENYYLEDRFEIRYSFSTLMSDIYWIEMNRILTTSQDLVFLGGTNPNISNYSIYTGDATWIASSTSLSSCRFLVNDQDGINIVPSNVAYFTDIRFYVNNENNYKWYNLELSFTISNTNYIYRIIACFDSSTGFIGCDLIKTPLNALLPRYIVGFPKSAFGLSIQADTTLDYDDGYYTGYDNGYYDGYNNRQVHYDDEVYQNGYDTGYQAGVAYGISETLAGGTEAMTIFAGIMDVAFIPVNVFFLMFDYEVFGINIAGFVSGLLTLAIVIILMRFIFGRRV